jgi:shikimate kinase
MSIPPRIALIGFMASGKSTVGRLLAKRLGYRFIDLDAEVETIAGKRIADIFRDSGEPEFRSMETRRLAELAESAGIVLAAGGGTPVQGTNQNFFSRSAATFYLDVSLDAALKRAGAADGSRPLLAQDPASLRGMFESRLPVYKALGKAVKTEGRSPMEIVEEILDLLAVTTPAPAPDQSG